MLAMTALHGSRCAVRRPIWHRCWHDERVRRTAPLLHTKAMTSAGGLCVSPGQLRQAGTNEQYKARQHMRVEVSPGPQFNAMPKEMSHRHRYRMKHNIRCLDQVAGTTEHMESSSSAAQLSHSCLMRTQSGLTGICDINLRVLVLRLIYGGAVLAVEHGMKLTNAGKPSARLP